MNIHIIHILSLKKEICSLIKKTLDPEKYHISCTHSDEITESFIENFDRQIDCLVLDIDIDDKLKNRIKEKFTNIPIICLPSLGSEFDQENGIKYMSEPFKLSELKKAIDDISSGEKK